MNNLYLRIYATVVLVLALFAGTSGWIFQRHIERERAHAESVFAERMEAQAELIQGSLPGAGASSDDQASALRDWSERLRLPLALDDVGGQRIATSDSFSRQQQGGAARGLAVRLDDGRTLWIMRPARRAGGPGMHIAVEGPPGGGHFGPDDMPPFLPFMPPGWQGIGLVIVLVLLFAAVAAGAYPVVRRLTRRLEALKLGVEQFGAGQLDHRVEVNGRDEVAAVAASFNVAAARVEALVTSHRSLLANASHELRSPLARMKMAVSMLDAAPAAQRERLKIEIDTNVAELDALVEEVLLASRLDAAPTAGQRDRVDLLGIAAEEAARVDAEVDGAPVMVIGEERLLRRALRNLLENARRYGGGDVSVTLHPVPSAAVVSKPATPGAADPCPKAANVANLAKVARAANATGGPRVRVQVCDRGPGVPEAMRERIFEPFFRLPGHAEQAGGVGLGLSLVKQIAQRHAGSVRCEARPGGGSCFVLELPLADPTWRPTAA